jgi:hypothetical protein
MTWDDDGLSKGHIFRGGGCPHAASGDLRALEADFASERTQLKARPDNHPWFQQKILGAGRGKTAGNGEFRIRLTLNGARLDVDQRAGGNRDFEVPGMTRKHIFSRRPGIALIGDSTAS